MIGQRGVPATFGGVERLVEEVSAELVARGHHVTVYCRPNYTAGRPAAYRGMRLRYVPTVGTKHLDAVVHSLLCTLDAMRMRPDVIHYHAIGPAVCAALPRIATRSTIVVTVHGMDNERAKWGSWPRRLLTVAAWLSARVPAATLTTSATLQEQFRALGGRRVVHVRHGVRAVSPRPATEISSRWGLFPGSFFLFVGRLVPEKRPDLLLRAFRRLPGEYRLVLAGGSSFTDDFVQTLLRLAARDRRILLPGYVYGEVLQELYSNAAAFVQPSELEGMPLTLLEAASYGTPVVASDIPPHVELLGAERPGQRLFADGDEDSLLTALQRVLLDPGEERRGAAALRERIVAGHDWAVAAAQTEAVYRDAGAGGRRHASRHRR